MQPGDNTIVVFDRDGPLRPRRLVTDPELSPLDLTVATTSLGPEPPLLRLRAPAILMPSVSRSDLTGPKLAPDRRFVVLSMPNESEAEDGA